MYNSKEIAGRIKSMVKQRGRSLGEVITSCELVYSLIHIYPNKLSISKRQIWGIKMPI